MNLLLQLVIGGVIGWLASIVMKTNAQMGIIANVVVGIVGSWLAGHFLAPLFGIAATDLIGSLLLGVAGAALLIFLLKVLGVFK